MRLLRPFFAGPLLILIAIGCTDSEPNGPTLPSTYDSTGFAVATVDQHRVVEAFESLESLMESARTPGVRVSLSELTSAIAPVRDEILPTFKDDLTGYARELADASGGAHDWKSIPDANSTGGTYGGYIFNEAGIDVEELIAKSLFSTLFYHQADKLAQKPVTKESLHRLLALYGASPQFRNSDQAEMDRDKLVAGYCARRDPNDGKGPYTLVKLEFIRAQAAVVAGDQAQAYASVRSILRMWERSQMATVINYCYATIEGLRASNVTDSIRARAMHAYGECVGILMGWRYIDESLRATTSAELDELLGLLFAPMNGPWKSYQLWQDPVTHLPNVITVRERLQDIWSFTDEEMISFKTNWVSAQGRK